VKISITTGQVVLINLTFWKNKWKFIIVVIGSLAVKTHIKQTKTFTYQSKSHAEANNYQ
jgi:hypothetical protein